MGDKHRIHTAAAQIFNRKLWSLKSMKYEISVAGEIPTAFELHCYSPGLPGCGANFWVISMSSIPPAIFPDPGLWSSYIHAHFHTGRCFICSLLKHRFRGGSQKNTFKHACYRLVLENYVFKKTVEKE